MSSWTLEAVFFLLFVCLLAFVYVLLFIYTFILLFIRLFILRRGLYSLGWPPTCCVAENDVDLLIVLPPTPEHWDSRQPTHVVSVVLGVKSGASCVVAEHSTIYLACAPSLWAVILYGPEEMIFSFLRCFFYKGGVSSYKIFKWGIQMRYEGTTVWLNYLND